jgi:arsenite transporter
MVCQFVSLGRVVSDSQWSISLWLNLPSALLPAIVVGLLVMMWPTLCKVQYEKLTTMFMTRDLWVQIGVSLVLNWVIGPFVMLGVASATLPDLPEYRTGVIMVGLAR